MDILFFAAIAVFIFFKLIAQLGKVDENQKRESIKQFLKEQTQINNPEQNSIQNSGSNQNTADTANENILEIVNHKPIDEKSQKILDELEDSLRVNFETTLNKTKISADIFLTGAKSAFEIIISAFSIGELPNLQPLLSDKIFLQFQATIADRNIKGEILNTKIISIDEAKPIAAKIEDQFGYITIMFRTKQINYIENSKKEIIFGSKTDINIITDNWTFKKDCNSKNPNWLLSSTS